MPRILKSALPAESVRTRRNDVITRVASILDDIRDRGDVAVREWSTTFDKWTPESFRLDAAQINDIVASLPAQVIEDIEFVQHQVRVFAEHQRASMSDFEIETLPGVHLGQKHIPVGRVGAYVPGGALPPHRVGPHDDRHRQGGRGAKRRGMHSTHSR